MLLSPRERPHGDSLPLQLLLIKSQIMGSCFFVSGMKYPQSRFNISTTNLITSLNFSALCCLLIPSTLYPLVADGEDLILIISRGNAIILLVLYILYLFFTVRTHSKLFEEPESDDTPADSADSPLGPIAATGWLAVSLACVTLCTVALVSSIQASTWNANTTFLGFILFPFLGNFTDYLSALRVAWNDKMDITILVTHGSSMQLLLFTLPILVILGWIINEPLTLRLNSFESGTAFLGVILVSYVVGGGRSNYLSGAMCNAL